jgi:hypothetical protein
MSSCSLYSHLLSSAAKLCVLGFGGILGRTPPGLIGLVPLDGGLEPVAKIGVAGRPAQLRVQARGIDGVAHVVAGTIRDVLVVLGVVAHQLENQLDDILVVHLAVGADEVGLAHHAFFQDREHGAIVVFHMDPVAHVLALAVELGLHAVDQVGDLARNELLDVLHRTVVVRAVGDGGTHLERAYPGTHQKIRSRLGGGIRAGGIVRSVLGEFGRVVQLQIAVDFVGGDVVVALVVLAHRLQERVRADQVGVQERRRIVQGIVVVAFGREVDDRIALGHQLIHELPVADVAMHEGVVGQDFLGPQAFPIARIREQIEVGHVPVRMFREDELNEIGTDETTAAGDEDLHMKTFFSK